MRGGGFSQNFIGSWHKTIKLTFYMEIMTNSPFWFVCDEEKKEDF